MQRPACGTQAGDIECVYGTIGGVGHGQVRRDVTG